MHHVRTRQDLPHMVDVGVVAFGSNERCEPGHEAGALAEWVWKARVEARCSSLPMHSMGQVDEHRHLTRQNSKMLQGKDLQ